VVLGGGGVSHTHVVCPAVRYCVACTRHAAPMCGLRVFSRRQRGESDRERNRGRVTERERQRESDKESYKESHRESATERERQRELQRERQRESDRESYRESDRESDRERVHDTVHTWRAGLYRGTSLLRKSTPLGPYRRPMLRVLGRSLGAGRRGAYKAGGLEVIKVSLPTGL